MYKFIGADGFVYESLIELQIGDEVEIAPWPKYAGDPPDTTKVAELNDRGYEGPCRQVVRYRRWVKI
jgi:hypothetical protein